MNYNVWGFHNKIENEKNLIDNGEIALGWSKIGDLSNVEINKENIYKIYKNSYPDVSKQSVANSASQILHFIKDAKNGDYVVFPTKYNHMINIGIITSDYFYDSEDENYKHKRKVDWKITIDREKFSQGALYESGSFLTFFKIKNYANEYINVLNGKPNKYDTEESEESIQSIESLIESTKDYILSNLSEKYKGYDLENVVADLLNAMGYRTKVSNHGGDHGIDIIAYKDELPPRILVQVKSRDNNVTESEVQSLKGALKEGDYGLFVTLSNFADNANNYLEQNPRIKSLNGAQLTDLILKYYDSMSDEFKENIKLKKIYIQDVSEGDN